MILNITMKYPSARDSFLPFQKIMDRFEEQGPTLIGKSILPQSFFHHYKTEKVNMLRTGNTKCNSHSFHLQL